MEPYSEPLGKSSLELGARGLCPRCGKGHIFKGFLTLAKQCEVCGLDYSFADRIRGSDLPSVLDTDQVMGSDD